MQPNGLSDDTPDDDLVAVAPDKAIFVSRLNTNTTAEAVKNYIGKRYNISSLSGFHVHKLRSDATSSFSSFKIFVGQNNHLYTTLMNEHFWPGNVNVREFVTREYFQRRSKPHTDLP